MTAAELVFRIQALGADELGKVAAATQSIGEGTRLAGASLKTFDSTLNSLVASGKSFKQALEEMARSQGVLSSAVRGTALELLNQIKAAEGDADAIRKVSLENTKLTASTLEARAAVQALNGSFGTMAAGRWLSTLEGLGPLMSAAFSVIGPLALLDVLNKVWERFDPLNKAEEELAATTKRLDGEYAQLGKRLERLNIEQMTAQFGKAAGMKLAAFYSDSDIAADKARVKDLQRQIEEAQSKLAGGQNSSAVPGAIGMFLSQRSEQAAKDKIAGLQDEQNFLKAKVGVDERQSSDDRAKADKELKHEADEKAKKAAEAAKQALEVTTGLQNQLLQAQTKELSIFAQIDAKRDEEIAKLKAKNELTKENLALINQIAATERGNAVTDIMGRAHKNVVEMSARAVADDERSDQRSSKFEGREFEESLKKLIHNLTQEITASERILKSSNDADAEGVRRGLQATVKRNQTQVAEGTLSGQGAQKADLTARITAAQQIFQIETQTYDVHKLDAALADLMAGKEVNLSDLEWKNAEQLADARKKYADEIYQAEAQYEEALDALRQKDLQKYRDEAGKIYDAITNRQRGAGFELKQMLRAEVVGTGRTIFQNATTPILQSVGHAIGGLTGGSNLGGLLNGTIFDPKNKGTDKAADTTAKQTTRTADEVYKLRMLFTGNVDTTDATAANPATSVAGAAVGSLSTAVSGASGNPLGALGTVLGIGGSGSSSGAASSGSTGILGAIGKLFGLSSGSTGQFAAGAGSVLSGNALNILTGNNTSGPTGLAAQIGAGVGVGGALALGGLGIASGISQGGAAGDLKAAGSAAGLVGAVVGNVAKLVGAASPLLSAIPVVGQIAALALPLIGSLFGSNVTKRTNQLNNELAQNQFVAPTALNVTQGPNGTYEDFDSRGLLRTSTLSAVPTVAEPYIWQQTHGLFGGQPTYYNVPGGVTSPFSGNPAGTGQAPISNVPQAHVTVNVNAIDTQSGAEFLMNNRAAVGNAVTSHLMGGGGEQLADAVRFHANS